MLKELKLTNFTAFPEATVKFAPGLNVVVGENGAGKSQLLKVAYSVCAVSAVMAKSKRQTKEQWQRQLADKLVATCRPDYLGRLVSRQQGRNRCEVRACFQAGPELDFQFSFASNSRTDVAMQKVPVAYLPAHPVFIPTREMLSIFPGFASVYEDQHLEFDETYYDLAKALGGAARKRHPAAVAELINELETLMDGHIRLENGRFYLLPNRAGAGKIEIPLVAEGLRKLAMLAYLLINGSLRSNGVLFWDEPETNLNPKLMVVTTKAMLHLAMQGYQVVIATHSLFLLREIEIQSKAQKTKTAVHYIGLSLGEEDLVMLDQGDDVADIDTLIMLDEELNQSDRYLAMDAGSVK